VLLGLRPEAFADGTTAPAHLPRIDVVAEVVEDLGADTLLHFPVAAPRPAIEGPVADGDDASLLAERTTLFTARVDPRYAASPGARVELAVDTARLHFFDPGSGDALPSAPSTVEAARETALSVE
jgi:multiple sugar transport system ATP-binding protein